MLAQHYISIGQMYCVIYVVAFLRHSHNNAAVPPNFEQSLNTVSMAGQRRIRWANIETVLGERHMCVGLLPLSMQQNQCWSSVSPAS